MTIIKCGAACLGAGEMSTTSDFGREEQNTEGVKRGNEDELSDRQLVRRPIRPRLLPPAASNAFFLIYIWDVVSFLLAAC